MEWFPVIEHDAYPYPDATCSISVPFLGQTPSFSCHILPSTIRRKIDPAFICDEDIDPVVLGPMWMQTAPLKTGTTVKSRKRNTHNRSLGVQSCIGNELQQLFRDIRLNRIDVILSAVLLWFIFVVRTA